MCFQGEPFPILKLSICSTSVLGKLLECLGVEHAVMITTEALYVRQDLQRFMCKAVSAAVIGGYTANIINMEGYSMGSFTL